MTFLAASHMPVPEVTAPPRNLASCRMVNLLSSPSWTVTGLVRSLSRFRAILTPGSWSVGLKAAICEYWAAAAAAAAIIAACISPAWGACWACWFICIRVDMGVDAINESDRLHKLGRMFLMASISEGLSRPGPGVYWSCCVYAGS